MARVFWSGRSQAVRLPKGFRPDCDVVTVRREGSALRLEPADAWPAPWKAAFGRPGVSDDFVRPPQGTLNRRAMLSSPHTHVLFCNGMYDLATPFFGAEIAARQLGTEPGVVARVHERTYEAGHMMYFHAGARARLTKDVAELIATSIA